MPKKFEEKSKYPFDSQAIEEMSRDILLHNRAQLKLIGSLIELLQEAMHECDDEDSDWYRESEDLVRGLSTRKTEYENHRFNQSNGYNVSDKSPYKPTQEENKITHMDLMTENQLNAIEASFGGEMNEEEIAKLFGEKKTKKKKKAKKLNKMTLEEIEELEKAQDNSNDIYKVSARIKNLARSGGANLTPVGDMLCNTFTHVVKEFYDFAETIQDKETKVKLVELLRKNENMPAQFIAATKNGAIR